MEIGTLSPDGHYEWDGAKWIPVQITKTSADGFWMWNGHEWIPNPNQPNESQVVGENPSQGLYQNDTNLVSILPNQTTVQPMTYVQPKKENRTVLWVSLAIIIPIVVIAISVVLAGILYVGASNLAEEQDQSELAGTWYNYADTLTLYPNGTVTESTESITKWSTEGYNFTTTFLIDGEEIDLIWRYEIKIDSDGDRILFMAYYDGENGTQTNEIADESCVAYIDSIRGADESYFENKTAIIPDWCEFNEQ